MEQNERHQLIVELAEMIAGLQVPYGLNKRALGEAADGWLRVWNRLHIIGWQDKETIRLKLISALLDEKAGEVKREGD